MKYYLQNSAANATANGLAVFVFKYIQKKGASRRSPVMLFLRQRDARSFFKKSDCNNRALNSS
jgi:hypothetical protein